MTFSGVGTSIVQFVILIILLIIIVGGSWGIVKWIRYMSLKKKVLERQYQKLKEE